MNCPPRATAPIVTALLAATLLTPTIAAATPAQDLARAYAQFDRRQWRTALTLANAYLAANGRNYSAELIAAGSACKLHPHLRSNAAPFQKLRADYSLPPQQARDVRDWIDDCTSPPPPPPPPPEAGVSASAVTSGPSTRVADPNLPAPPLRNPPRPPVIARPVVVATPEIVRPAVTPAVSADACANGYVWREAFAGDHVCVVPATRTAAAEDNAAAASRVDPAGAYGPATCIAGYVWREARASDLVCVVPKRRAQAKTDNAQARQRLAR